MEVEVESGMNTQRTNGGSVTVGLPLPVISAKPMSEGATYFIQAGEAIKIGSSANFRRRLQTIQTSHEKPLVVLAVVPSSVAGEYEMHQRFSDLRISGEWFRSDAILLDFIASLKRHDMNIPAPKNPIGDIRRQLARHKRRHPSNHWIGVLMQQLEGLKKSPELLGPLILETIKKIEDQQT